MSDAHRVKIQNSNILNALIEHAVGEREMTSTQVTSGIALLKKVMPDLSAVTIGNEGDKPFKTEEVGGAAKLSSFLTGIAERSGTDSSPE